MLFLSGSKRRLARMSVVFIALGVCACEDEVQLPYGQEQYTPPFVVTPQGLTIKATDAICDTELYHLFVQNIDRTDSIRPLPMLSKADLDKTVVHDCQRLVENDTLGPLVSVLASTDSIEKLDFTQGRLVAEIINYSPQTYQHLAIQSGVSCLWIKDEGNRWVAAIRRPSQGHCLQQFVGAPPAAQTLEVVRLTYDGKTYPSTARWMWDEANGRQFIGIRCGEGWCEIGNDFQPTPRFTDVKTIPGWSDEQFLSYNVNGQLQLSGVYGRIEPNPQLVGTPATLQVDVPRATAKITLTNGNPLVLDAAMEYYINKFKLTQLADRAEGVLNVRKSQNGGALPPTLTVNTTAASVWTPTTYNAHNPHAGTGATRFAWSELDEGAWFWCNGGCCRNDNICGPNGCN